MSLLTPQHWKEYELIDTGGFEKLERFGAYVLSRPEPQAVWDKSLPEEQWQNLAHAVFRRDAKNPEKGSWNVIKKLKDPWYIKYDYKQMQLRLKLSLASFKHVGIFPEQASNWDYIYDQLSQMNVERPKVLNLFAYTGAASLAAKAAGADVTHLDSIKPVITWARENMEASNLRDIRWIVDDAMKFVKKEERRGNKYNGIILDPPAYGRGPAGEKWLLEEHINEMLKLCSGLIDPNNYFVLINLYSIGFSYLILENLISSTFGKVKDAEFGELYLQDRQKRKLPLGIYGRFQIFK